MNTTYTKITPNIFTAVKMLLENGATNDECAKYMKISVGSVKHIKAAQDFDEYRAIVAAISARKKEQQKQKQAAPAVPVVQETPVQVVEHRQSVQISATHYMETKLDVMIDLLKGISAKLAAIIDDLYGTGKKEGA